MNIAQSNIVLNPSLENHYDTTALGIASFSRLFVTNWSDPNFGSSDYYTPKSAGEVTTPPKNGFGFEYPHTGYCYGGFIVYEETSSTAYGYVQASFSSPMITGQSYSIECYVSLAEYSLCISNLGFYFSDTSVSIFAGDILPLSPQFTNPDINMISTKKGWQRITGNYTAHGGENYLSIGNFLPYGASHIDTCALYDPIFNASYLFIDDVAVYDTSKVDTINLCMNDSVEIGGVWLHNEGPVTDIIGGLPVRFYIHQRSSSANLTILTKPFLDGDSVKIVLLQSAGPDSSTSIVGLYNFLYVKTDTTIDIPMYNIYGCDSTVRYVCGTNIGINHISYYINWSVYPNPANDYLQITINNNDPNSYSISIIDITGKEVKSLSISNAAIDISLLKSGMYFAKLLNTKTGKVVGNEKFVKE